MFSMPDIVMVESSLEDTLEPNWYVTNVIAFIYTMSR